MKGAMIVREGPSRRLIILLIVVLLRVLAITIKGLFNEEAEGRKVAGGVDLKVVVAVAAVIGQPLMEVMVHGLSSMLISQHTIQLATIYKSMNVRFI